MEHACLETFPQKTFQGHDIPTEMTGHQSSKALLNSLYGAEFICFKDIHPPMAKREHKGSSCYKKKGLLAMTLHPLKLLESFLRQLGAVHWIRRLIIKLD